MNKAEKIDFVILWVDGNDESWQKEKSKYEADKNNTDSSNTRYREWGLLKYWFRSVEKNAPWVNRVYFVTNGQKPDWLNIDCEKLVHVKHEDFMPQRYLPTFNANPIELNLHRIKGLSNRFIFFNDDMFILKRLKPSFFFNGALPRDEAVINPMIVMENSVSTHMLVNDIEYINNAYKKNDVIKNNFSKWFSLRYGSKLARTIAMMPFKKFAGLYFDHMPASFIKNDYIEAWKTYGDVFESTSMNKFRSKNDVNHWLIKANRMCKGKFFPRSTEFGKNIVISDDTINEIDKIIAKKSKKIICLNDGEYDDKTFDRLKRRLVKTFDDMYPDKSMYEK